MGRVVLIYFNGKKESLKCRSEERAYTIMRKRPNVRTFNFYEDNQRIPKETPKIGSPVPSSFEELEAMSRKQRDGRGKMFM